MILYGASGHAKVIIDTIKGNNNSISFLFDDNSNINKFKDYQVVNKYNSDLNPAEELIISIGDNKTRKKIVSIIKHKYGKAISNNAIISANSFIDEGTVVFHGAIIQSESSIGKHVIINTNSSIDHDCLIGDFTHISPGVSIAGGVTIGEGTHIGIGSCIIQNIKIGRWCVIGAGSVVIRDIPDYAVVVGNPAKIIKYNSND